jgi:predicted nucleic acid-binding protein
VSVYLDANVLVALFFTDDPLSTRAYELVQVNMQALIVSDLAAAEFASVIGRHVRMRNIAPALARKTFSDFDRWAETTERAAVTPADISTADAYLRRLNLNLRAPDAIHLATTQRLRAEFATFDKALAAGARALKISLASP